LFAAGIETILLTGKVIPFRLSAGCLPGVWSSNAKQGLGLAFIGAARQKQCQTDDTMFAAFLAPSVIEHTYGSMRHLLVCQLHLVKRPVNHPRCSRRLEVFATTVSVTDQLEMQQCTSDVCFIPKSIHVQCN
jgi:hypothetical protein